MRIKLLLTILVISIISIFLIIHFLPKITNTDTFTFKTPQINLHKGLKSRIGKGLIHDVVYLPDGTQFAVASSTGIWFYDANTYEETTLIATDKPAVKMMSISSDGKKLATIGDNKAILLWDLETLKHKTTFIRDSEPYFNLYFDFVSFISDGQTLVSNLPGRTDLWDLTTGTHQLKLSNYSISEGVFSSDGRIAVSTRDAVVYVWDVVENNLLKKIKIHSPVSFYMKNGAALSSNGTILAYSIHENNIELWDIESEKQMETLKGHKKSIECLAFSPDGNTLASGSTDYSVILWDVTTGKRKKTLKKHANEIRKVIFSPDGKTLLSYDRSNILKLWEVETGKLIYSLRDHINIATSISLSPDGLTIVSGSPRGYIHLWDVTTAKHKKAFKGHKNFVSSVSYSPDGLTIASASWDETVYLWDVTTGKRRNNFTPPPGNIRNVVFSPVDQLLAGVTEKNIQIWDLDTMQQKYTPIVHKSVPQYVGLSFSPDGKIIASNDNSHTISLWDVATGNLMKTMKLKQHLWQTSHIFFSPDGKTIASLNPNGTTIDLWDVTTGVHKQTLKNIQILRRYGGSFFSWEFSPDGKYLVAGSFDFTLSIWDVGTGKLVKTIKGFSHRISGIAFSQDGKTLLTRGDGAVLVWDFATLINGSD